MLSSSHLKFKQKVRVVLVVQDRKRRGGNKKQNKKKGEREEREERKWEKEERERDSLWENEFFLKIIIFKINKYYIL